MNSFTIPFNILMSMIVVVFTCVAVLSKIYDRKLHNLEGHIEYLRQRDGMTFEQMKAVVERIDSMDKYFDECIGEITVVKDVLESQYSGTPLEVVHQETKIDRLTRWETAHEELHAVDAKLADDLGFDAIELMNEELS